MNPLYLYAAALVTFRFTARFTKVTASSVYVCLAESHQDATEKAFFEAFDRWPTAKGWHEHEVNVAEVSGDLIQKAADMLRGAH